MADTDGVGHVQATHQDVLAFGQVIGDRDVSHCGDNIPTFRDENLTGCRAESRHEPVISTVFFDMLFLL